MRRVDFIAPSNAPAGSDAPAGPGAPARWTPAPGEPFDRCWKCGRPTPLGTSLCADDNPGRIGAPSATQAHGTIFVGVLAGFVALALLARLALASAGPFGAVVESAITRPDGGVDVVVRVTNQGTSESVATCRISRGGVGENDDPVFLTGRIRPGASATFQRILPATRTGERPFTVDRLSVTCR
jgi:hypothetical protein